MIIHNLSLWVEIVWLLHNWKWLFNSFILGAPKLSAFLTQSGISNGTIIRCQAKIHPPVRVSHTRPSGDDSVTTRQNQMYYSTTAPLPSYSTAEKNTSNISWHEKATKSTKNTTEGLYKNQGEWISAFEVNDVATLAEQRESCSWNSVNHGNCRYWFFLHKKFKCFPFYAKNRKISSVYLQLFFFRSFTLT